MDVKVHPRVMERHPQLTEDDVLIAWRNAHYEALRPNAPNFPEYLRIGFDGKGREVEMVGTMTTSGWLVYHANTPLSARTRREVNRARRRRRWQRTRWKTDMS